MLEIYKNIKARRIELGLTQNQLAKIMGYTDRSAIAKIEAGVNDIPQSKIEAFAEALQTTPGKLMGLPDYEKDTSYKIPVLDRIIAGAPISEVKEILGHEEIPYELASTGNFFALRIHGDSMAPRIIDGDIVIVRQQSDAESDDVVIVTVSSEDGICKRLRKRSDGIELISNNPAYSTLLFTSNDIKDLPVVIAGKVVELRGKENF
jgi:repressor LexA